MTDTKTDNDTSIAVCDRCGDEIQEGNHVALDAVIHPHETICADCVKPDDEIVDV